MSDAIKSRIYKIQSCRLKLRAHSPQRTESGFRSTCYNIQEFLSGQTIKTVVVVIQITTRKRQEKFQVTKENRTFNEAPATMHINGSSSKITFGTLLRVMLRTVRVHFRIITFTVIFGTGLTVMMILKRDLTYTAQS